MSFWRRKKIARLYEQWIKQSGLSPENIPPGVLGEESAKESDLAPEQEKVSGYTGTIDIDRGMVRLHVRHVVILICIIAVLLVTLSVVITILVLRP